MQDDAHVSACFSVLLASESEPRSGKLEGPRARPAKLSAYRTGSCPERLWTGHAPHAHYCFWKALLKIRSTQNGRRHSPDEGHRNCQWTSHTNTRDARAVSLLYDPATPSCHLRCIRLIIPGRADAPRRGTAGGAEWSRVAMLPRAWPRELHSGSDSHGPRLWPGDKRPRHKSEPTPLEVAWG